MFQGADGPGVGQGDMEQEESEEDDGEDLDDPVDDNNWRKCYPRIYSKKTWFLNYSIYVHNFLLTIS